LNDYDEDEDVWSKISFTDGINTTLASSDD